MDPCIMTLACSRDDFFFLNIFENLFMVAAIYFWNPFSSFWEIVLVTRPLIALDLLRAATEIDLSSELTEILSRISRAFTFDPR